MENLKARYLSNLKRARDELRHAHDMAVLWSCTDTYALIHMALNRLMGSAGSHGYAVVSEISRELHDLMHETDDASRHRVTVLVSKLIWVCDQTIAAAAPTAEVRFGRRPSVLPPPPEPTPGEKLPLLLIVDDDVTIRELLSDLFMDEARILTAIDADEAQEAITRHRPDLVLLDDIMPGSITGLTLLERLDVRRNPSMRIIMVTASDGEADQARGLAAGALDYITKPFVVTDVYQRVQAHLGTPAPVW